jgi:DUF4097 and DUF4098 domain-containing protein YvlB
MTMTLTRSIAVLCVAGFLPAGAAAQVASLPAPPPAHGPSASWLEHYQDSRHGPEQTETWTRTFTVGASGWLDLSNLAGEVVVTGGAGDQIKVDAVKRVRARDAAAAKDLLAQLTIESVEKAGRVEIKTEYPRGHNVSAEIDFTVQVPSASGVAIHTVSGDIRVSQVKGEVTLESVSGNIVGTGLWQVARLKSVSGDVEVTDGGASNGFAAGSVSGNVVTRRVKARSMDVQSVSGDVALRDVTCERAQVKSVSGDVEYDGAFAKGGRYEFTSHSGDLRVAVGGGAGFEITANSFSGDVRSELPGFTPATDDDDRPGRHEVRATIGDGSAVVIVKTFSGDLLVTGPGAKAKDKKKDRE